MILNKKHGDVFTVNIDGEGMSCKKVKICVRDRTAIVTLYGLKGTVRRLRGPNTLAIFFDDRTFLNALVWRKHSPENIVFTVYKSI